MAEQMTILQLLKKVKDEEKFTMEIAQIYSRQLYHKFIELQKAGFEKNEALQLILTHGLECK